MSSMVSSSLGNEDEEPASGLSPDPLAAPVPRITPCGRSILARSSLSGGRPGGRLVVIRCLDVPVEASVVELAPARMAGSGSSLTNSISSGTPSPSRLT